MGIVERMRLDGKKGFVTGAARGIGKATATAFAEAGADVAIVDLDIEEAKKTAAEIAEKTGRKVIAIKTDVTDEADVQAMVDQVVAEQLADEELGGDIVQLSAGDGLDPFLSLFLNKTQKGQIQLLIAGILNGLAAEGGQLGGNHFVHKSSSCSEDFTCIFTLAGILYPH